MNATTVSSVHPEYSFVFQFEREFDPWMARQWMQQHWHQAFYYSAVYVAFVFIGQRVMSQRPPMKLEGPLVIWNLLLAGFSTLGALRMLPELVYTFYILGYRDTICNPRYIEDIKVTAFWTWIFCISKLPELGDTVFLVLRKREVAFLHWYHHITVLVYSWFSYKESVANARWFITMNFVVHALMYTYFALKSLHVKVPKWTAMSITTAQIGQMIVGAVVCYSAYLMRSSPDLCRVSARSSRYGLLMYLSYLILFSRLFYTSYLTRRTPRIKSQ